jgi:prophage regulatory protein
MRILRFPEVAAKVGLKSAQICHLISQGRFPAQVKLGPKASGWVEAEIDAWIEQRVNERNSGAAPRVVVGKAKAEVLQG